MEWKLLSCLLLQACVEINGYNILAVFPVCTLSHYYLGLNFVSILAEKGHNVTMISCYTLNKPKNNFQHVLVEETREILESSESELKNFGQKPYLQQLYWISDIGEWITREIFKNKSVQKLINSNNKFDAVIMENFINDAMAVFSHIFKCPLIVFAPGPATLFNYHFVDNPSSPAFVSNLLVNFNSRMNFWERLENTYKQISGELFARFYQLPRHDKIVKEFFPNAPDLTTMLYNVSLLLLTSSAGLSDPIPLQQNVKQIGGYHITPSKPLPDEIQEYLDNAEHGVILFSMGSHFKIDSLGPDTISHILNSFSKVKQKIICNFVVDFPNIPDNVKIFKWLPQQDILEHPNTIGLISHGGLFSIIEAAYFGVPVIGIPVFWDQFRNIAESEGKGYAIKLNLNTLSELTLVNAINELVSNPSYRMNAKKISRILRDRPVNQVDEAVYWVEYVIRHGGAYHLQSPSLYLKWYEKYLLDVILFAVSIGVVVVIFLRISFRLLLKRNIKKEKTL